MALKGNMAIETARRIVRIHTAAIHALLHSGLEGDTTPLQANGANVCNGKADVGRSPLQRTAQPTRVDVEGELTSVGLDLKLIEALEKIVVIKPSAAQHVPSLDEVESNLAPVFWLVCGREKGP
jgi:hypothetical protein